MKRMTTLACGMLLALVLVACDGDGTPTGTPGGGIETPTAPAETPVNGTPSPGTPAGTPTMTPEGSPTPDSTPVNGQSPDGELVAQGEAIFNGQASDIQQACSSCHTVGGGQLVGPDLQGVGTRAAERVEGQSAEEYVRESIIDPGAHVVEGFPNIMPPGYDNQLSDEELDALVAYLMSLE